MDLFIHLQIANIYFIYLFIKEFIFYWDMKRIQAPKPNERAFTVPIFALSSVMIQQWHYIAVHPKPGYSDFIVNQLQKKLILCAHTIASWLSLYWKECYGFLTYESALQNCIEFKCTFKKGIKNDFTLLGLLSFLKCLFAHYM